VIDSPAARSVILYDGLCGLCDRYVQFVLRHDHRHSFRFAPLQGAYAKRALARQGIDLGDGDPSTIALLEKADAPGERVRVRSDAVLTVITGLGGLWRLAGIFRAVPRPVRDVVYDWVARVRYRVFGKRDACAIPSVGEVSNRFLP
jgi:predicted DCC family thiol-disulfide oxidoreductase YuxK